MDNKTHMMFHDQEIREETAEKTRKETRKEIRSQDIKISKLLNTWQSKGLSQREMSKKLKYNFNLTDQEIHDYLS